MIFRELPQFISFRRKGESEIFTKMNNDPFRNTLKEDGSVTSTLNNTEVEPI